MRKRRSTTEALNVFLPGQVPDLPLDTVTKTLIILGKKDSGKTYLAGVLEEEFAKHKVPFTVIDPMGAHWGIKDKYPVVVFGGSQPDVPLDPNIGKKVAEITVNSGMSNILDLGEWSRTSQRHFIADFSETIQQLNRTPRMLLYEEADIVLPQLVTGETSRVYNIVDDVVRRGRQHGLGVSVISQRPAKLNKDATSQADAYFFFHFIAPQDKKAAAEYLEGDLDKPELKQLESRMPKLEKGHCILYSPRWLEAGGIELTVRRRETYHAGRTPELGEKMTFRPVPVDVADLGPLLQEAIAGQAEERTELQTAKGELKRLQDELEKARQRLEIRGEIASYLKQTNPPGAKGPLVLTGDQAIELETKYGERIASLESTNNKQQIEISDLRMELSELQPYITLKLALDGIYNKSQQNHTIPAVDPAKPEWAAIWLNKLPQAPKKILQFLLDHPGKTFTAVQLAQLTGYQYRSGTWVAAMATLRRNKLVRDSKEGVRLA